MDDDDEVLLAKWRLGDRGAGERLFARHFQMVRRYFANKVQDDPEELIQATFLACIEGRDRFEGRSAFSVYLLGIARNLLRRSWEKKRRRGLITDIDDLAIADLGAGPSSVLARTHVERRMLQALRQIPLADQELLELYYWQQLTGPQLAELVGMSEDGIRSRLRRAKEALGKQYRRMEHFAGLPESSDIDIEKWAAGIKLKRQDDPAADGDDVAQTDPRPVNGTPADDDDDDDA